MYIDLLSAIVVRIKCVCVCSYIYITYLGLGLVGKYLKHFVFSV